MKRLALVVGALILTGGYAQAGDIPVIDPDVFCEKLSKIRPPGDKYEQLAFVPACHVVEKAAYAKIYYKWASIPIHISDRCVRVSAGYENLNKCLDDTLQGPLPSDVPFFTLYDGGREARYWTHGECMEARNGGSGVCIGH